MDVASCGPRSPCFPTLVFLLCFVVAVSDTQKASLPQCSWGSGFKNPQPWLWLDWSPTLLLHQVPQRKYLQNISMSRCWHEFKIYSKLIYYFSSSTFLTRRDCNVFLYRKYSFSFSTGPKSLQLGKKYVFCSVTDIVWKRGEVPFCLCWGWCS